MMARWQHQSMNTQYIIHSILNILCQIFIYNFTQWIRMYSIIYLFNHSLIYVFSHLLIHSSTDSSVHQLSFIHELIDLFINSFTIHQFVYLSFIHSFIYQVMDLFINSFFSSSTHLFIINLFFYPSTSIHYLSSHSLIIHSLTGWFNDLLVHLFLNILSSFLNSFIYHSFINWFMYSLIHSPFINSFIYYSSIQTIIK